MSKRFDQASSGRSLLPLLEGWGDQPDGHWRHGGAAPGIPLPPLPPPCQLILSHACWATAGVTLAGYRRHLIIKQQSWLTRKFMGFHHLSLVDQGSHCHSRLDIVVSSAETNTLLSDLSLQYIADICPALQIVPGKCFERRSTKHHEQSTVILIQILCVSCQYLLFFYSSVPALFAMSELPCSCISLTAMVFPIHPDCNLACRISLWIGSSASSVSHAKWAHLKSTTENLFPEWQISSTLTRSRVEARDSSQRCPSDLSLGNLVLALSFRSEIKGGAVSFACQT